MSSTHAITQSREIGALALALAEVQASLPAQLALGEGGPVVEERALAGLLAVLSAPLAINRLALLQLSGDDLETAAPCGHRVTISVVTQILHRPTGEFVRTSLSSLSEDVSTGGVLRDLARLRAASITGILALPAIAGGPVSQAAAGRLPSLIAPSAGSETTDDQKRPSAQVTREARPSASVDSASRESGSGPAELARAKSEADSLCRALATRLQNSAPVRNLITEITGAPHLAAITETAHVARIHELIARLRAELGSGVGPKGTLTAA